MMMPPEETWAARSGMSQDGEAKGSLPPRREGSESTVAGQSGEKSHGVLFPCGFLSINDTESDGVDAEAQGPGWRK